MASSKHAKIYSLDSTRTRSIEPKKNKRNIQQWGFAGGHPPNY
ncbi:hypothetical protein BofuT4_P161720.1 [Botrytis cinerea T4]|uniref:Uncharacterized protein n=1 Tax=Botryotinia fuckeliana (strain T4) TaxID=999810 RepID=G2YTX3_BOTF4|nr:hypothetical protein BofuT4_P161720.1 [Botrytis cinerea T4]